MDEHAKLLVPRITPKDLPDSPGLWVQLNAKKTAIARILNFLETPSLEKLEVTGVTAGNWICVAELIFDEKKTPNAQPVPSFFKDIDFAGIEIQIARNMVEGRRMKSAWHGVAKHDSVSGQVIVIGTDFVGEMQFPVSGGMEVKAGEQVAIVDGEVLKKAFVTANVDPATGKCRCPVCVYARKQQKINR